MGKMRVVLKQSPAPGLTLGEKEIPVPGAGEVLVKVIATGICGTDFHIWSWDKWSAARIKPPIVFGHEFTGEVVDIGSEVHRIKKGDFVSAETHIVCNRCYECLTGKKHVCKNVKILGVDVDGTFAEYVKIPEENAWLVPSNRPKEISAIMEPLGNAVHTVMEVDVRGKTVLITGCGPIGLMAIEVAHAVGASKIIATDTNDYRLSIAKQLNVNYVFNPLKDNIEKEILEITHGEGVDVLLEMSGAFAAIESGFKILRPGGEVSLLGIPSDRVSIDFAEAIIFKGAVIHGIVGRRMYETWYTMEELLSNNRINISPIITHKMKLDNIEEGMELIKAGKSGKIVLYP